MKSARANPSLAAVWAALLTLSAGAALAGADVVENLRAEVRALKAINDPAQPVWVRFTLFNPTDQPIDVALPHGAGTDNGVGLPVELLFGSSVQPAIAVGYQDERLTTIMPPTGVTPTSQPAGAALRLAPRSSLGADLDLRTHFRAMRYDGQYRVEWRPLDGRMQGATADVLVERRKDAIVITDQGKLTFSLTYDSAPRNVDNFLELVRSGFYDGKTIHRIVPGFIIQGGCPHGDGSGVRADGRLIAAEFTAAPVEAGTLMMARKPAEPNSASCQFFIALTRLTELDGQYTIVGHARDDESMRTLQALAGLPTNKSDRPMQSLIIRSIKLIDTQGPQPTSRSSARTP